MSRSTLTLREVRARAVNVPLQRPLYTSGGSLTTSPLVLIDLLTEEGVTGSAYVFCYTPIALKPVVDLIVGMAGWLRGETVAPLVLEQKIAARLRLLGPQGLTGIAAAGIDMAAWDALARAQDLPLARLLGGDQRPIPAYNSCGLGIIGAERAAAEAQELVAQADFGAIKVRLGYPTLHEDVAVVRAVRKAIGDDVLLMSDYNQSLNVAEAIRRAHALDDEGLYWIEEPIRADDYAGHAQISRDITTPIQIGENWWGSHDMAKSVAAGASDFVMPDAEKIGGVTGWLRAATLAHAHGLPVSGHLFPEISTHLLAATPTAHWLEYLDIASPILTQPLTIEKGQAVMRDAPGIGLEWNEDAVRRFRVE